MKAGDAAIALVQVRATGGDPIAARLGLERLLGSLELRPRGLPPAAILCVRELVDPLPGTLALDSRRLRPPPAWEQAVQRALDGLAREASRPARDAVPAGSRAVLFADEAELLACLAGDWVTGAYAGRWWWPLLIERIAPPRRAVVRAWLRAPEHAPAALRALAERGQAEAFVRALDGGEARALAAAVAVRFALPAVAALLGATPAAPPARVAAAAVAPAAPWREVAPEAEQPGLSLEGCTLLGLALTLVRAPSVARTPSFAPALAAWRAAAPPVTMVAPPAETAPTVDAAPAVAVPPPSAEVPVAPRAPAAGDPSVAAVARPAPARPAGPGDGPVAPPLTAPARQASPIATAEPSLAWPAEQALAEQADVAPAPPPQSPSPVPAATQPGEDRRPAPAPRALLSLRPRRAFGPVVETELGGLFYLLSLALHLRLYGDEDNLALSPWDFVALVGAELLGGEAADDAIWPLLAELAGRREDEPPGAGFVPPDDWRLPPRWLAGFPPALVRCSLADGRLIARHPDGFLLVDLAAEDGPAPPPSGAPLRRWLARLVPFLRARLRRALLVDDAELPALLLRHRARVHVSDSHVDVVMSLERLPLDIRFAGLDRDPGWVAAAGRHIAFHFE